MHWKLGLWSLPLSLNLHLDPVSKKNRLTCTTGPDDAPPDMANDKEFLSYCFFFVKAVTGSNVGWQ